MGSQFIEKQVAEQFSIESLTPIVKLTNGFSVTLFTKNGSPLKAWQDWPLDGYVFCVYPTGLRFDGERCLQIPCRSRSDRRESRFGRGSQP